MVTAVQAPTETIFALAVRVNERIAAVDRVRAVFEEHIEGAPPGEALGLAMLGVDVTRAILNGGALR